MNEKNVAYLKDQLKYLGFGDKLNAELEAQLKRGAPEFELQLTTEINKRPFQTTLQFRKSADTDLYFFNHYHASLKRMDGTTKDQVFYLSPGKGITAKEAYNLLEGRAVYKALTNPTGQSYKAWLQLDFGKRDHHNNHDVKQFHDNYGFDLKQVLSRYAIAELNTREQENALLKALQKGNVPAITLAIPGSVAKVFVQANPRYKNVTFYDAQFKPMHQEQLRPYHTGERVSNPDMKKDPAVKQQTEGEETNLAKRNKLESGVSTTKQREETPDQAKTRQTKSAPEFVWPGESVIGKREGRHL